MEIKLMLDLCLNKHIQSSIIQYDKYQEKRCVSDDK
jgi:hypothetical protein